MSHTIDARLLGAVFVPVAVRVVEVVEETTTSMQNLRREAAVALGVLARSADYRDRADAGHGLARFAEMPEAGGLLLELVLDADDTFVTLVTVRALFRRMDRDGLEIVASALAEADDSHSDWIHTAAQEVFGVFADDRDAALRLCEEVSRDTDERMALGARRLVEILAEINPMLRPVQREDGYGVPLRPQRR